MKKSVVLLLLAFCSLQALAQELAVSTNIADYLNMGTLNVETSYGFARHWSADASVKYNPFTFGTVDDERHNRQRSVAAGVKYWPWHIYSGWWLSGNMRYQEYNSGGFKSERTVEGDRVGGSLQAGYSYMVSRHLDFNVGAGLWAGRDVYKVYSCPRCGKVVESGGRFFFLPSDLILSLAYIF